MTVILKRSTSKAWHVPADLAIDLRASALADRVAGVVLEAHRKAILAGTRANDGAVQPKLDPRGQQGRRAAAGKRPNFRGNTGRPNGFPRSLRRGRTKKGRADTNTTVVIEAPGKFVPWLAREDTRGVEYLFTDGAIAKAIEDETMRWLEEITRPDKR